jgi:hypothetical protein
MSRKSWPGIAIRTTRGSDGFLCVLFVAACIWAFVFGGDWFRYFFVAAVAGGLVAAGAMQLGGRAMESGYRSQGDGDQDLDYNRKQE